MAGKTVRDPELWNRLVNDRFGDAQPILSPDESVRAAKKLWRHAMGKIFAGEVRITSGRRATRVLRGVLYVNPDERRASARGLREIIHSISHACHYRLHPNDAPHSARQARLEGRLVEFALSRGFTEGALKREPAPAPLKPTVVQRRYARMVRRRDKWAADLDRARRLLAKAQREVREYERRHAGKLEAVTDGRP